MKRRNQSLKLLASSKISERKVKEVIFCYANKMTVKATCKETGLSHVTIYRLFGYIRKRLLLVGVFIARSRFVDLTNEREDEGSDFDWANFSVHMRREIGQHRGIRQRNAEAYNAEAVYRFENNHTSEQTYRLILLAILATGPLNREPVRFTIGKVHAELFRLMTANLRSSLRAGGLAQDDIFLQLAHAMDEIGENVADTIEDVGTNARDKE